ncbi:MAG: hypothetical protein M5R36_26300 [Deltaproteobacteria bacterium]|nr:hypothetical protein [Deltaproteobacteria bacterium]
MSWETYRIPELYACLGLIAFIGIVIAVILEAFEERLIHWKRR